MDYFIESKFPEKTVGVFFRQGEIREICQSKIRRCMKKEVKNQKSTIKGCG